MIFNFAGHLSNFTERTRLDFIESFKHFLTHTDTLVKEEYELSGKCTIEGKYSSLVINANTDNLVMLCSVTPQALARVKGYAGLTFDEVSKIYKSCTGKLPVVYISNSRCNVIIDTQGHNDAFINSIMDPYAQFRNWVKEHPSDLLDKITRRMVGNLDVNGIVPVEDLWDLKCTKFNYTITVCIDVFKEHYPKTDIKSYLESTYAMGVERYLFNNDNKVRNWVKSIVNSYEFKDKLSGLLDKTLNSHMYTLGEEAVKSVERRDFILSILPEHIHSDFAKTCEIILNHRKDLALQRDCESDHCDHDD